MFFTEPGRRRAVGDARRRVLTADHRSAVALRRDRCCSACCPGPVLDLAGQCGRIHQVTDRLRSPRGWPCRSSTPTSPPGCATGWPRSRSALAGHVRSRRRFVTEAASHLMAAGGKRFRPLLVLLAAEAGAHPDVGRGGHRRVRRGADPPGLALPRRRDGRGRAAPRRRLGQRPLGQPRRDPHRRLPVLQVLRADRRARAPTPSASRRRPSPGWSRARSWRRCSPAPGEDPLDALPRGRRRQDRLADRHLGPLRRRSSAARPPRSSRR